MQNKMSQRAKSLTARLRQTNSETKEHIAATAAILAITLILFAPLLRGRTFSMVGAHMFAQYPWIGVIKNNPEIGGRGYPQTDHAEFFYPTSVFATNAVRSGQLPMWLPYTFNGVPEMEIGVANGLLYPPRLLLMTVFSPIRQHDLLLFAHFLIAGLGMYALMRCWGANALGAVFGAIVWAMNGHRAYYLTYESLVIAAAWFPLMMLGATLAIKKQSVPWAVATGAALGMCLLGNTYFAYVSAWVLTCWYLVLIVPVSRRLFLEQRPRSVVFCLSLALISAVIALGLGAASWLTLFSALARVNRGSETLQQQLRLAIPLGSFLRALLLPQSAGGVANKGGDVASFAFVGTPALVFVLAGFLRRSAPAFFASATGLISVGIVLGLRPLIGFLRLVLPQFSAMHLTHVGIFLFCFAVAALAAFGITEVGKCFRGSDSQRLSFLKIALPLIAVEALQLILFTWIINPSQPAQSQWLFPETPLISSLKAHQGEFHILPIYLHLPGEPWTPPMLAGKVAAGFDLRSSSGYESIMPISTVTLWRTVGMGGKPVTDIRGEPYKPYFYSDLLPVILLKNLSVGLLATHPNARLRDVNGSDPVASGAARLIYSGPDGDIYQLKGALPRAFLAPRVLIAPDQPAALRMLVEEGFDARKAAIVIGENTAASTHLPVGGDSSSDEPGATATIVTDRLNEVEIRAVTQRAAMLVLNDSWHEGWKVFVDGVEQPVLRVNYDFRGVVVAEGTHRVTFLYRPKLLLVGIAISGGALLLLLIACAWLGIFWLRRRKKSASDTPKA